MELCHECGNAMNFSKIVSALSAYSRTQARFSGVSDVGPEQRWHRSINALCKGGSCTINYDVKNKLYKF